MIPEVSHPHARDHALGEVYASASPTLRALRALGWGPQLLNLGYYRWRGALNALNLLPSRFRLAAAQQRLVREAAALLAPAAGDRVLDVACGRGYSSYYLAASHPRVEVLGVDLLPENVAVARTLYAHTRDLSYACADALATGQADASFDRVLCAEAAFHFPDRARFLAEAARVLKPGGTLVVVDFAWKEDERSAVLADVRTKTVQKIWGWQDFSSVREYREAARAAGLALVAEQDWTARVTRPLQGQFDALARISRRKWGRALLCATHAPLRGLSRADWTDLASSAKAHAFVNAHSRYMAFVWTKGGAR